LETIILQLKNHCILIFNKAHNSCSQTRRNFKKEEIADNWHQHIPDDLISLMLQLLLLSAVIPFYRLLIDRPGDD
jgi:hypothetical protein